MGDLEVEFQRVYMRYRWGGGGGGRTKPYYCTLASAVNGSERALTTLTLIVLSVKHECMSFEILSRRLMVMSF